MMDNIREKLVEILAKADDCCKHTACSICVYHKESSALGLSRCKEVLYANTLIANGVTIKGVENDTVKPVINCHGFAEWEKKEHDRCGVYWFECSKCHTKWGYGAVLHMKFCPNCGAKMTEET